MPFQKNVDFWPFFDFSRFRTPKRGVFGPFWPFSGFDVKTIQIGHFGLFSMISGLKFMVRKSSSMAPGLRGPEGGPVGVLQYLPRYPSPEGGLYPGSQGPAQVPLRRPLQDPRYLARIGVSWTPFGGMESAGEGYFLLCIVHE